MQAAREEGWMGAVRAPRNDLLVGGASRTEGSGQAVRSRLAYACEHHEEAKVCLLNDRCHASEGLSRLACRSLAQMREPQRDAGQASCSEVGVLQTLESCLCLGNRPCRSALHDRDDRTASADHSSDIVDVICRVP